MRPLEGPHVDQVLSSQGGIAVQQLGFTGPESPDLNQQSDRDACTHDAGFAPTDLDIGLDSRECIIQIAHQSLQDLGLLGPAQLREERFGIPKRAHDEAYPW